METPDIDRNAQLKALADRLDDDGRVKAPQYKQPERRARRVNQQRFDEVTIRTVPRYKTSSLSGDEWRFSAVGEIKYKGRLVWEDTHSSVPEMLAEAARVVHSEGFAPPITDDLCDQEGCAEPWVNVYKIKKQYCAHCGHGEEPYTDELVRKFCVRHSQRGNCSREDSQENYETVTGETPIATTRAEDERPAVFGGIIVLHE
jgi:hypothetical protein